MKRTSGNAFATEGRGTCRGCKERKPLYVRNGLVASHPLKRDGKAVRGTSCIGSGSLPVSDKA